ncbi:MULTISPECIES: MFS transporter [Arthrobacter]|uniref:MFS transporter n=1 Tax=Arthrobacter terricola TaxID=2547396 RepID=A0A4R5KJL2_9MICC|nr:MULTISPECIES: MFS transporter [Arthrobacter]MBT8161537.1 MFS transporter [Arthrobacter sp. GN70]TDF95701.1 MFS transporter [Arthrobacter terricola]
MRTSSKWLALAAFSLSTLVIGLDATVLAVALPTLARALNATQSELQWFSTAFLLTVAGGMLPASVIADRAGRKKTLLAALVIFGGSALWSAYVTGPGQLIAARAIMGFAAALISVVTLGVIPVLFDSAERGKAIGVMMVATFLGLPIGPLLGGWILTNFWWGWIFLMNVPVAGLAFVLVLTLVPESRPDTPGPLDLIGLVLSIGGLTALCYGFVRAGSNGWADLEALTWIGSGVVTLVLVAGWEQHMAATGQAPLIAPSLFRLRGFTAGTLVPWIGQFALVGMLFILPMYGQAVRSEDAMGSGIRLLPLIAGFIVAAVLGDRLAKLLGPKAVATGGYLIMAVGVFLGARMTAVSSDLYVAVWLAIAGLGMGLGLVTAASVALRYVPADKANQASAVFQALQKTGGPLGAAVIGSALSQAYQQHLALPPDLPGGMTDTIKSGVFQGLAVADRVPLVRSAVRDAFDTGMATTLWICVGIAIAAALAALVLLPGRVDTADRTAPTSAPEMRHSRNPAPGV